MADYRVKMHVEFVVLADNEDDAERKVLARLEVDPFLGYDDYELDEVIVEPKDETCPWCSKPNPDNAGEMHKECFAAWSKDYDERHAQDEEVPSHIAQKEDLD